MRPIVIMVTLPALLLAGCDDGRQAPPPKLFESQRNAMDKARGVENTLQQQAEQQQQEIDQQTQ